VNRVKLHLKLLGVSCRPKLSKD